MDVCFATVYPFTITISVRKGSVNMLITDSFELHSLCLGRDLNTKLMRIELSNRECTFLRLLSSFRIPTNTIIVRYMISEIYDARCIAADL